MKKNLAKKVTLSILAGAVLMSSGVVWAAQVTTLPPGTGWEKVNLGVDYSIWHTSGEEIKLSIGTNENLASVFSNAGDATGGKVTISGGSFNGDIYGGYFRSTPKQTGKATGNTVTISGGTFAGNVYGGFTEDGAATNNTVNVNGTADLKDVNLYGGFAPLYVIKPGQEKPTIVGMGGSYGGSNAPNTLNIGTLQYSWANLHNTSSSNNVKKIAGFDVINFEHVKWDTTNPALKVDKLELAPNISSSPINGTTITVENLYVEDNDNTFVANAVMTLIDSGYTDGELSMDSKVLKIHQGVAKIYDAEIFPEYSGDLNDDGDEDDIFIGLGNSDNGLQESGTGTYPGSTPSTGGDEGGSGEGTGSGSGSGSGNTGEGGTTPQPERNDQVLVLGESRAAAVAFTNQGSELIETGLNALARDNEKDTKVFAVVYGNHSEYETGSHVNVNGWSGIVGIGKTNANGLTVGAFFENGEGNYSTHNIFTNDYIRGDGEACYNGGGLLVRKDNANGVYTEASIRAGNLQNELRNAVRNGSELTGYDIDTFYYGAHVGVGKVIARGNDGDSIDVYGKFIYTHHDGETFDIGGTATKFDSVESERLRLGFRINEVQTNKLSMYYGAAWEYEFNGDAHDKIASFDLETPSLEGSTVIGEIGAHYKASEKWSIDLNGRAYVGQREGFSGSVQANYAF